MSSPGLEAHEVLKPETAIHLDANLLTDWLTERADLRQRAGRLTAGLAATSALLVAMAILVPSTIISSWVKSGAAKSELGKIAAASDQMKAMEKELADLKSQSSLNSATKTAATKALNRLMLAVNAKNEGVVLRTLSLQIISDKLEVSGDAEATGYLAAARFIQAMEQAAPGSESVLVSAKQSAALGGDGINFQFLNTGRAKS